MRIIIVYGMDKKVAATAQMPAKVKGEALFGAARVLVITHNGRDYHLRVTQNGKLILTA